MEDYAWVIDYMPFGKSTDVRRESIVQLVGHTYFTLLEAKVKKDAEVSVGDKVYIGKGNRDIIGKIKGRISYQDLTENAKNNLLPVLKKIVVEREPYFIEFINHAGPLSIRVHQLELMPGIGKKYLKELLEEREKEPFKSFKDLKERIKSFPDPSTIFAERIVDELKGEEKHLFFTKPFIQHIRRPFRRGL